MHNSYISYFSYLIEQQDIYVSTASFIWSCWQWALSLQGSILLLENVSFKFFGEQFEFLDIYGQNEKTLA